MRLLSGRSIAGEEALAMGPVTALAADPEEAALAKELTARLEAAK